MTRVDIRRALDMLPRFDSRDSRGRHLNRNNMWSTSGHQVMTNLPTADKKFLKIMDNVVDQTDAWGYSWPVRMVDVSGTVVGIHASLLMKGLKFLLSKNWEWQKWSRRRLPIYISYCGKLLIWNGTHRLTLARLANRKVRARILVVEDFIVWKKKHPERKPSKETMLAVQERAKKFIRQRKAKAKAKRKVTVR